MYPSCPRAAGGGFDGARAQFIFSDECEKREERNGWVTLPIACARSGELVKEVESVSMKAAAVAWLAKSSMGI
ncbi:unnamed protein product [Urochloa humidicola]